MVEANECVAVTGTNSWNAKMVLGWNGPTPRIMMTHEDMYLIDLTELTIWENNDMMTIGTYNGHTFVYLQIIVKRCETRCMNDWTIRTIGHSK